MGLRKQDQKISRLGLVDEKKSIVRHLRDRDAMVFRAHLLSSIVLKNKRRLT